MSFNAAELTGRLEVVVLDHLAALCLDVLDNVVLVRVRRGLLERDHDWC